VIDRLDGRPDLVPRQRPGVPRQAGDAELEPHVDVPGAVVAQHVGLQAQCQLRRAAARVAPLEPGGRVVARVRPRVERAGRAVLLDDDFAPLFGSRTAVELLARRAQVAERDER
jgi:hypothetical protein